MKPLISVIVPVYKAEEYLDKCIESLVNQTYANLEIILVNDGSPDRCPDICEKWKKRDNRIVVLNKENGGQSDARNAGMRIAKGTYFIFVDSDDYVSKDYVEYLYGILESAGADIAIGKMGKFFDGSDLNTEHVDKNYILTFNSTEAIRDFLYEKHISTSINSKIFKRELFDNIEFPKGKIFEDLYIFYKVVAKCNTVVYGDRLIYYYRIRTDSTIGTLDPLKNKDFLLAAKDVHTYVINHCLTIKKAADFKLFQAAIEMFVHLPLKDNNHEQRCYREELWQYILEYRLQILLDSNCRFKYRLLAFISFWGKGTLSRFFQLVSRR